MSIRKLSYMNNQVHSGEYHCNIHRFNSIQETANQSKRNIASGLSLGGGIHQSLQDVKNCGQDDHLLVSNEHGKDSPILSNKLEYA